MAIRGRAADRGTRRAEHALNTLADEFRTARLAGGLTQAAVAAAATISRSKYSRIEGAHSRRLALRDAARIAAVLGLDLSVRAYPNGDPVRDAAQMRLLAPLAEAIARPLRLGLEVALPRLEAHLELRAWDGEITGAGSRTTIEAETRLYDLQGQARRIALKRRDDPSDQFLLVVADTPANRRVLRLHPELWPELPRLKPGAVIEALRRGRHPQTGLALLKPPVMKATAARNRR